MNMHPWLAFCRRHGSVLAGFGGLALLFYAPIVLGIRTFPDGDFTHHFLPFSLFQQAALAHGELPIWNPYTYGGHPFLADTQAAVFYPLNNLLLVLTLPWQTPGARLYWLEMEAVLQIILAGYFTYLLTHSLTGSRPAAFAAGCAFAFSGYLTGYPPLQLAILRTAIWLPLLLYLLLRAAQQPTAWRWWAGAALAYVTAFWAGHPQTFLYLTYITAAWLFFLAVQTHQAAGWWSPLRRVQAAGLLFFLAASSGLSAAQLLPSLEFTGLSVRAQVDYDFVSGGLPHQDTWQLLLPGVLTYFSPLYIGVVGIGLGLIGLGLTPRAVAQPADASASTMPGIARGGQFFFLALAVIALLLAYGGNGWLYPVFYRFAPGWKLFRGQERAALGVALGLSVLAGYGLAALPRLAYARRRRLAVLFALLVAAGVYGFGLFWQLLGHSAVSNGRYLAIALVTLALALALITVVSLPGWSGRRTGLVVALLFVNLFWTNVATNLDQFSPARKTILAPEMEVLAEAVANAPVSATGLPGRIYNEFRVYEDYGMRQQLEDVWGSSPLRLARYAALFDQFPLDRMWRLLGVAHVLTWRRELFGPSTLLAEFPQSSDTTYLHRLPAANPRAWFVNEVRPRDDGTALTLLADHTFNLDQIALLSPAELTSIQRLNPGVNTVQLTRLAANRIQVTATSAQGGLLVISENWMPGWRVENVHCETTPCPTSLLSDLPRLTVQRTDLTLLGVVVPAGTVHFVLRYWPASVQIGLWISGGTGLLLLLGGWCRQRGKWL
ncbi:MAG: hypothetical protein R3C14_28560 [Caldilineaceae bacterium]